MSKIFLLGHKGFVGSHLLPKLQEANYEVVTDLRYWSDRHDVIINMAAVTHLRQEFDPKLIESNIILPYHLFNRPERIIYASSCSARHNTNPYASSKIWSEFLGDKHGNALGLRFFNLYGLGNSKGIVWHLMNQSDGAKITIRGGDLIRDYLHVEDCVDEIMRCLKWDWPTRKTYNPVSFPISGSNVLDVGTGIGTSTISLIALYQELSGKRFDITFVPADIGDPQEMISNNAIPHVDLKMGLLKLINHETV